MKKTTASFPSLLLLAIPFLFSQCTYHAYFQSPFYGNSEPYQAIPLQSDSLKSATYVSGAFTMGGVNQSIRDDIYSFTGSFHRSHNFGNFQGYYGANLAVGSYTVSEYGFYEYNRSGVTGDSLPSQSKAGQPIFWRVWCGRRNRLCTSFWQGQRMAGSGSFFYPAKGVRGLPEFSKEHAGFSGRCHPQK